jgi:hypothetical protein
MLTSTVHTLCAVVLRASGGQMRRGHGGRWTTTASFPVPSYFNRVLDFVTRRNWLELELAIEDHSAFKLEVELFGRTPWDEGLLGGATLTSTDLQQQAARGRGGALMVGGRGGDSGRVVFRLERPQHVFVPRQPAARAGPGAAEAAVPGASDQNAGPAVPPVQRPVQALLHEAHGLSSAAWRELEELEPAAYWIPDARPPPPPKPDAAKLAEVSRVGAALGLRSAVPHRSCPCAGRRQGGG